MLGGGVAYPGRYIILSRMVKSMAVSEDRIRGHPLGDFAIAKFFGANIWPRVGEWKDEVLVWTRGRVLSHRTSTFPTSR